MSDWLTHLYSKNNYWFLSGHSSCSKKFGLSNNENVSIIFSANKNKIYAYFINIGLDFNNLSVVKNNLSNSLSLKIIKKFNKMFNKKFHVILFDNKKDSEKFSVTDDFSKYTDMNSMELIKYFKNIDPDLIKNKGTFKNINKSINSNFQIWVRKNLSKYIVKSDMDILSIHPHMLIELKKVKEDIENWTPYLDDLSNYRCMRNICRKNNIHFLVVSYQIHRENEIAIHVIDKLNKDYIIGRRVICNPNNINIDKKVFNIPKGIGEYKSTNRRIKFNY